MGIPPDDGYSGGTALKPWDEIFPGLDSNPLRGRSYQFTSAATESRHLKESMLFCSEEFKRLSGDEGLRELEGSAPRALAQLVTQLDGAFHDLPPVFERLESIFDSHATRLSDLEGQAIAALARANTRWNAVQTAEDELATADAALTTINNQIAALQGATDEVSIAELETLQEQQPGIAATRNNKSSTLTTARELLADSRTEYGTFGPAELEIIGATRSALGDIDLKDLEDPGWLEDKLGDIGDFFKKIGENFGKFLEALADGRILDALHHLSDVLNSLLIIIAAIVIVIVVVIAVVGTGGAALGALAAIATGLGALKLVTDSILAGTAHPHPDTGQPKTWGQVAVDAILMVLPVPGSRLLSRSLAARLISRVPPGGYTSARAARTYRQNQRVLAAAERGTGMGARSQGNHLTARQVRERAGDARQYNDAYDQAHRTHQNNIDNANQLGQDAGQAGPNAGRDLAGEVGKKIAEPVLSGQADPFGPGDVGDLADNPAVQEGARRHVDRCTRSVQQYSHNGPSSRPGTPHVCLVAAP